MATKKKTPINEVQAITEAIAENTAETAVETTENTPEKNSEKAEETKAEAVKTALEAATKPTESTAEKSVETKADGAEKATQPTQTLTLKRLMNIRKSPSLKAEILATKEKGTVLPVVELKDDWLKVVLDETEAFMLYERGKNGTLSN